MASHYTVTQTQLSHGLREALSDQPLLTSEASSSLLPSCSIYPITLASLHLPDTLLCLSHLSVSPMGTQLAISL